MTLLYFLRFLQKGDKSNMEVPVEEQRAFLMELPEPRDDVHRSYLQYRCQNYFVTKWKVWLFNFLATVLFVPTVLWEVCRSLIVKNSVHYDALSSLKGMEEVMPDDLVSRYDIFYYGRIPKGILTFSDIWYCFGILIRFFPSTYFAFKMMVKVAQYSELIKKYSPIAIITHSEYSFASSLLTDYCHKRGVKQINVMHGEKLYNIRDSFFHFDECYVWNDYYIKLLSELKAYKDQFIISVPPSLKINLEKNYKKEYYADYKYYLAEFNEVEIKSITESFSFVKKQGYSVRYRLHPRYLDMKVVKKYIPSEEIENPKNVSIVESIASCKFVVGSYTTVLLQAYCSGRNIILDDVTFRKQYEKLVEMKYILAHNNIPVLSEYQK